MSDDPEPKPRRLGYDRKDPRPQHDQPCQRIPYSDSKSLFDMLKTEAEDG